MAKFEKLEKHCTFYQQIDEICDIKKLEIDLWSKKFCSNLKSNPNGVFFNPEIEKKPE